MAPPAPTGLCGYNSAAIRWGAEGAEEALDPSELGESDKLTYREIDKEFFSPPPPDLQT